MTEQPLLQLEPSELRIIYNSIEIDVLKDVLLVVGYIKKYEEMELEELREEYKTTGNNTKKHIIKQVGRCKKQKTQ